MLPTDSILPVDASELEWSDRRTDVLATQQLIRCQVREFILRDKVLHHVRDASEKFHGLNRATDCCRINHKEPICICWQADQYSLSVCTSFIEFCSVSLKLTFRQYPATHTNHMLYLCTTSQ